MADKRISQLNSHTTPSGSDLLVIVNNNETKKITYANLSAALTGSQTDISALNQFTQSIDGRVDNLESWSSSLDSTFATDLQVSIVSSSVAATIGVITQNTGLVTTASFNSFTQSIDSRVDGIENLTSSFATTGSNQFTGSQNISGSVVVDGTINASSVSATTLSTNGGYITNDSNDVLVGTDAILGYKILTNANTHTFHFDVDGNLSVPGNLIGATNFNTITNKPSLISGSSQLTASYDSRYVLSGSITQTTWDNISGKPDGLVSQSVSLSSLNAFTASYFTDSASIDGRVLTEKGRIDAILSASTANADTFAEIVTLINSVDTTNDNAFASYYTSSNARISSLENTTSSYETKGSDIVSGSSQLTSSLDLRYATSASYLTSLNGAFSSSIQTLGGSGVYSSSAQLPNGLISGSSQLTSSYDIRYTLSGSVQPLPNGLISGSSQLTASYDTRYALSGSSVSINTGSFATTGSNTFIGTETISGSLLLSGSFSYNGTPLQNGFAFAQPQLTRILDNVSYTGSSAWVTSYNGNGGAIIVTANVSGYRTTGGLGTAQLLRDGVVVASQTFYFNLANYHTPLPPIVYTRNSETGSHTYSIYFSNILADTNDYATINVLEYGNSALFPTTIISGSTQLTSSFDVRYEGVGRGIVSGSTQLTSSFETKGSGIYSSSAQLPSGLISGSSQLPNGLVSGSSQLTASYDTRYALSGSGGSTTIPAGTVSGSSQLTSSYDGRYTLTSSFNAFTASAQAVTTGSNSFNGTQTITGSLIITTGSFVGSQILANTSSLYLTSGSNMYVQNNGVVEITGSLKVSGSANFNVSVLSVDGRSGDEGGEINLAIPVTNTTLQNRVTTDIWQNRFRVFEGSANAKGVFVDLSKAPAGVGGELLWKASGIVNTGVDVILGDLKARIPSTGNKSLQLSTTSGVTYSVHGSGVYSQSGTVVGTTLSTALSVTSTPTYIVSGYNFGTAGATDTWVLMDTSNAIAWRITMIIGFAFNNNFISIERLH